MSNFTNNRINNLLHLVEKSTHNRYWIRDPYINPWNMNSWNMNPWNLNPWNRQQLNRNPRNLNPWNRQQLNSNPRNRHVNPWQADKEWIL